MGPARKNASRKACRDHVARSDDQAGFGFRFLCAHLTFSLVTRSAPSHLELSPQNPVEQTEQADRRSDQHQRVEDEDVDFHPEISFFLAEENIRFSAAPVIVLLHFRVGDQIGNLLVHVELLGRHRAVWRP